MREAVEKRGGHLGIAEDAGPFAEGQIGGDYDRGAFVELADQVEQELAAGLGEGQIAEFVQDQEVETGYEIGRPTLTFRAGLSVELVYQVDHIEEPAPSSFSDAGAGNADCEVGFARAGSADQNQVALMVEEVTSCQIADQGLVDVGGFEVELVDLFGQRQLGDGHLVFDRTRLLLSDLSMQQITNDLLWFMLAFDRCRDDLVVCCSHPVEFQLAHGVQYVSAFHFVVSLSCHTGRNWLLARKPASARPEW